MIAINLLIMDEKRRCLACGEIIHGRSDKKFCSDYCRNDYNNKKKSEHLKQISKIDKILHSNRNILEKLCPDGKITIDKLKLSSGGFDFSFFTNIYKTRKDDIYYFCYDYGYRYLPDSNRILIVKKKDWA